MANSRKKISTWHIHVEGQVQGVGFRPFVYFLANRLQVKGWVHNAADGVHIEFNSDESTSRLFYNQVILNAPLQSVITAHFIKETLPVSYTDFTIRTSSVQGQGSLLIAPDFGMCAACRYDIMDPHNRRYHYAFTTCTQCGPRFSILKQLPYDRENTAMDIFNMCSLCHDEFHDAHNRRHYSQTNSCPRCATKMEIFDSDQQSIEDNQDNIIAKICSLWNAGKIVAIKGIGGYILTCNASDPKAIRELRKRKHRPFKPFALMFPDVQSIEKELLLNDAAIQDLKSASSPIVILRLKNNVSYSFALEDIAPQLSTCGAMVPYTPLYHLLLQHFNKPIVATSGNISQSPIVFEDSKALNGLNSIADFILVHNREICTPQDDSVIKFSTLYQQKILIRRSRGLAPLYGKSDVDIPETTVVAMGALLKSSFSVFHQHNIHVSPYMGNLENFDAQNNFDLSVRNFLDLFHIEPSVIVVDKHPGYFSTIYGEQMAKETIARLVRVQHHEAHFASVLGEHQLLNDTETVLGVIWDGTGWGDDGQIWGGDFFLFNDNRMSRLTHFSYFDHFLGDKMSEEPRLSAFSLCHTIDEALPLLHSKFTSIEWNNYIKLIANNQLKTSSVGRIFDAVASLLGLADKNSYEGQGAMLLEKMASTFFLKEIVIPGNWLHNETHDQHLSSQSLIKTTILKLLNGTSKPEIAAWFHVQLVVSIRETASQQGVKKIGCSGGVFQNGLLVDIMIKLLGNEYQLFFNRHLPPNDENISFGQLMYLSLLKQQLIN